MKYSENQQKFLDSVLSGENVFLTGKAGTGKSFIVQESIKQLNDLGRKIVAVAPTGIAAQNIKGQTMHSMFGLNIHGVLDFEKVNFLKSQKRNLIKNIKTIFIDEISMLRPDHLDAIDWTLKKNGCGSLSDKQVIFIGDMKQLPAPINDNTMSVLLEKYDGYTFNKAKIYKSLKTKKILLEKVQRQNDLEFIENLNIVREGGKSEYFRQFVNKEKQGVILAPHNTTVKKYNQEGLESLNSELIKFKAKIEGNAQAYEFNVDDEIEVKDGAKIMYLVNSVDAKELVNGTLGTFKVKNNDFFIEVNGIDYLLEKKEFTKKEYVFNEKTNEIELQEIGKITQYPFKLAYALSIHKSQGLTFKKVTIDLTRSCFVKGQLYTALSRVESPDGLTLIV